MPIVKIYGGLGNQLFQYSFAYAVARKTEEPIILDLSLYTRVNDATFNLNHLSIDIDNFFSYKESNIIFRKIAKAKRWLRFRNYSFFKEKEPFFLYDINEIAKPKTYYDGYFSFYTYFNNYRKDLIDMYNPNFKYSNDANTILSKIRESNSIAVHFRRGDYVQIGVSLFDDYYKKAIEMCKEKYEKPVFFVFSNDTDYAIKAMESMTDKVNFVPVILNDELKDIVEFFLMKECKHHIIANSTYSWWAAYLANHDEDVIAPIIGHWNKKIYPDNWKLIPAKYEVENE